ncbi:MAG: 4Fe-4S dicluster domain-containing protein, partial [Bacteroidales bacterium]|nr:4Fe-4S dicluster domain-containing protein [Bacteroidales bacterium]
YNAFKTRFLDNGLIDYFLHERELGHIRQLGFSFHGNQAGFDEMMELHDKYHWDFVQIQMNYVDWNHASTGACNASYMYEELTKRNIPVVIMEPLLGGSLSSVPDAVAAEMKSREPSKSVASWAFRFVGSKPNVLVALSGMTYMEHLKDNLDTYLHFKPLTESDFNFLEDMAGLIRSYPLVSCTGCQYCMPCPFGIDIPTIFRHYNSQVNSAQMVESVEQADYKKLKRLYLTSYDKALDSVRQADHCIGCNTCLPKCPQHIRIPSELSRIDAYVEKLKRDNF